jgi:glycosyltransferase involved in cell wall biosynthesis
MEHSPKVSVLIPTYNYAYCLDEAMQSVLDQTLSDFELIVIDDCSKDNTDDVMQKYLTDPRITYMKNEKNLGLVGNWNKCLSYAKGDYIKILCADDKFRKDLLEKMVNVMEKYKNVYLVACNK